MNAGWLTTRWSGPGQLGDFRSNRLGRAAQLEIVRQASSGNIMNDRDSVQLATRNVLEAARALIRKRFKEGSHHISAAVQARSGEVYAAVNLETHVGRQAICAEAVAIGMAAAGGDAQIELMVAVDHEGAIVSPCGSCRELLCDFSPEAKVIVPAAEGSDPFDLVPIRELLPRKYHRRE
jgi:cytidine deaminase